VFNTVAKLEFGLAAVALILGIALQVAVDEPVGFVLLLGISAAAVLAGLALTGSGIIDRAPRYGTQSPPIEMVTVDPLLVSRPNPWPAVTAIAIGILGVGLAVGSAVVYVGVIAVLIAAAGWFAQSWREDPSFTPREGTKISDRLIAPLGLPILALGLVAVIVISVSRVLLAVPKEASIAIAGGMAVLLLVAFFILSSRPSVARAGLVFLSGFAVVSVVAAGSVSAAAGYRTFDRPAEASQGPLIQAQNTQYKQKQITVKSGDNARITFDNLDKGTYHNIAVYTQASGGRPIWNGEPVRGVKKIVYQHVFDQPGTYSFRCDFHPTAMIGTFTVQGGQ
jgi:plastocyanin